MSRFEDNYDETNSLSIGMGLTKIGMGLLGLKVEDFRTDGTSNYLANLNYRGQTWAAALRLPARGATLEQFLTEKRRALQAVGYLLQVLRSGISIGWDCTLKFEGVSCFVENASVQEYLKLQSTEQPLVLIDDINKREKTIQGFNYPEALPDDSREYITNYSGPFYLSRGAPAWETLEDYPELEEPVAHALARLHLVTGQGMPIPFEIASSVLSELESVVEYACDEWTPKDGSKEARALKKSLSKWNANNDETRSRLIRRERYLRTADGQTLFRETISNRLSQQPLPDQPLRSFSHGDCHGGNFILVRFQYSLNRPAVILDRVFLNEIFEKNQQLRNVSITIEEKAGRIHHKLYDETHPPTLLATRKLHHDIHLIDLDNGLGTTAETKVLHVYDALAYSLSLANLTRLFASPIPSHEVLKHYYQGLERNS